MGLDISAFEKVTLVRAMTVQQANAEDYDPYPRAETLLYVDHPSRTQHDGMAEGAYAYEGEGVSFRAGSYGGYNRWRDDLADMIGAPHAGKNHPPGGPFEELIHFADNEGFMGPKTSAKLAADFDESRERAEAYASTTRDAAWFMECYENWSRAFHLAAVNGAVKFH